MLVKLSAGLLVPVYFLLHCSIVVILNLPLPMLLNSFIMVSEWCPWAWTLPHADFSLKAGLASPLPTAILSLSSTPWCATLTRTKKTSIGSPVSVRPLNPCRLKITLVTLAPSLFYFWGDIFNRDQFWGLVYDMACGQCGANEMVQTVICYCAVGSGIGLGVLKVLLTPKSSRK